MGCGVSGEWVMDHNDNHDNGAKLKLTQFQFSAIMIIIMIIMSIITNKHSSVKS